MVHSQLGNILKEFESFFQCPLTPDTNDSCLIRTGNISLQIELDRYGLLLIGCHIATMPSSRYRNNLIHAALRFNEATLPSTGIFGFSQKLQEFILFLTIDPQSITPHLISSTLPPFLNKAKQWMETIEKNEVPSLAITTPKSSGIFGLIS